MERFEGWLSGFYAAFRLVFENQKVGWFTPETVPAWVSAFAAISSVAATALAIRISRQTIMNENKKETIRLLIEAGALYERVSDFLSVEKTIIHLKLESLPNIFQFNFAKHSILRTLADHEVNSALKKTSIYERLDVAIEEKNHDIGLWQEKLSEAQKLFSDAGRAMPMVETSLRSQMQMLQPIIEVFQSAANRTKEPRIEGWTEFAMRRNRKAPPRPVLKTGQRAR